MTTETNADTSIEVGEKQELDTTSEPTRPGPVFVPPVDIFEDDEGITVIADVPGASNDGIAIDLDNDALTIEADVVEFAGESETELVTEWTSGRFYRQFTLPDQVDQERITANLNDGVLRIHLPKVERAKRRRIAVTAG